MLGTKGLFSIVMKRHSNTCARSFPSYSNTICNIYDKICFSNQFYDTMDRILYCTFLYSFCDSPLFNILGETFYGIYSMFADSTYPHYCKCTYIEVSSSPLFIVGNQMIFATWYTQNVIMKLIRSTYNTVHKRLIVRY